MIYILKYLIGQFGESLENKRFYFFNNIHITDDVRNKIFYFNINLGMLK